MSIKTSHVFSVKRLRTPGTWSQPSVLMSSLAINILALALPTVILQVYDRIIPNQAIGTFIFLILGMLGVVIIDTALRIFRSSILSWHGAKFDHRESLKAMNRILDADNQAFEDNTAGYYLDKIQALEQIQEFYSGQSVLLIMDLPFVILFLGLIWLIAGPSGCDSNCSAGYFPGSSLRHRTQAEKGAGNPLYHGRPAPELHYRIP